MNHTSLVRAHSNPEYIARELNINTATKSGMALLDTFYENASKRIAIDLLAKLPKREHDVLEDLLAKGDIEGVYALMREKLLNFQQFLTDEIQNEVRDTRALMGS